MLLRRRGLHLLMTLHDRLDEAGTPGTHGALGLATLGGLAWLTRVSEWTRIRFGKLEKDSRYEQRLLP